MIDPLFALCLGGGVVLYLVIDLFDRINIFIRYGADIKWVILFLLYKVPLMVYQIVPATMMLAILLTLGLMTRNNEVLATLDDTEIRITHQQTQIQLEQARLNLEEETKNYERSKELKTRELISEQEFQAAEALYKQRQLELESNQAKLDLAESKLEDRKEKLERIRSQLR